MLSYCLSTPRNPKSSSIGISSDTLLLLRTDVQLADRSLLALEQISEGGQETVRGYRQDLLLADNGFLPRQKLGFPCYDCPSSMGYYS